MVILPGALAERADSRSPTSSPRSCLMGTGQFCTNPGLVMLVAGEATEQFIARCPSKLQAAPRRHAALRGASHRWARASHDAAGGRRQRWSRRSARGGAGLPFRQHAARASRATQFLAEPEKLQTEAFGNASLFVVAGTRRQLAALVDALEGNLTGCIYSDTRGRDDALHATLAPRLRPQSRPTAQRQDAHRRRRQPRDEPRRPVSRPRAIPASRPSASPRRCAASRCSSATTTCGRRACPACCGTGRRTTGSSA